MLSLLLVQGRSYQEVATMLHMSSADVRERAHEAARLLLGENGEQPSPAGRARIIDYLLGEQSVSERELTRSELISLEVSRAWATRLSATFALFAHEPLPAIPGPQTSGLAVAPEQADPRPAPAAPPVSDPPAAPEPPRGRTTRRGTIAGIAGIAGAVIAVIAVIVAVVLIATGGSSSPARPNSASTTPANSASSTTPSTGAGKTIRHLVLTGTASGQNAFGAGAVVSQHGGLLLLLQARGLAPNHHNFYGVWLYNSQQDAKLLGFVAPPVGAAGTFSSSVALPADATRFHSVIVTVEPTDLSKVPGTAVLRSPLSVR